MPGVSAPESNEIVKELQDVGQVISQETSQLVDALSSLGLDQEDTDKAIARLSMDATLAKAQSEGHAQTIEKLRSELAEEKSKKEEAESSVREVMGDLQSLATEFKTLQDKAGAKEESKASRDDLIKVRRISTHRT
jgi:chromosome segregation ATPase